MSAARQLVLLSMNDDGGTLGLRRDFLETLALYNTAPDGSEENTGVAFGPGLRIELPFVGDGDPVTQALVTITEEDNAWPVLSRLCRHNNWRLLDPDSGRTFGL